jgi:deferrochelatase/peroxidase EfeB
MTSRRGLLKVGGAAVLGTAAIAGSGVAACKSSASEPAAPSDQVDFYGAHQAGIATPAPARLAFASYDVVTTGTVSQRRAALIELLRDWTAAAAAMTSGHTVPGDNTNPDAPPADTGEAFGARPANLTITIGFGASLFDERFGLSGKRPAALADLPHLPPANLNPDTSDGDLCIQACSDDPIVAFHAIRNLARIGRGTVVMRWSQLGFGKAIGTGNGSGETPRNLMGFKDGTRNIETTDPAMLNTHVWVGGESDQQWMAGGSYLVVRRIRMFIEAWDRDRLSDQEAVIGRSKYTGAPLGGAAEFDTPNFTATGAGKEPVIPMDSHIRLAAHETNNGTRILRRGYSFTDGMLPTGELDAGLFFMAYQKDPRTQFVPLQRKLGSNDALNEYIQHVASGLFACPPGVPAAGDYWGSALLA